MPIIFYKLLQNVEHLKNSHGGDWGDEVHIGQQDPQLCNETSKEEGPYWFPFGRSDRKRVEKGYDAVLGYGLKESWSS